MGPDISGLTPSQGYGPFKVHIRFKTDNGFHKMNRQKKSIPKAMLDRLTDVCEMSGILLLGVTGGIASGKSTVARLFEKLGAPSIDFDILARQVVEPEKPAWKDTIEYFGRDILMKDGLFDRKKLAQIVFKDPEKRKRLEGFIHPRINDEFIGEVENIAGKRSGLIVQAVIPLLFEVHLEDLVHKILLVYIPREKQIERLMNRDGISQDDTSRTLSAQLPIDNKIPLADFVIHNDKSVEETKKQVDELYATLKKLRNRRYQS